jgi:hypothetical protein
MNLFKGLLFLEGYVTDPHLFDEPFAPQYGNQRASERTFRGGFAEPEFGRAAASADAAAAASCG